MHNSFISLVTVLHHPSEARLLGQLLTGTHRVLAQHFSDFEIIIVNNGLYQPADEAIAPLSPDLKHHIFLLNLSSRVNKNHAIMAGLDRSNGDYTVIFEPDMSERPELILDLFEATRQHFDIVYLRAQQRKASLVSRGLYAIFYYIFRRYSPFSIDDRAHDTRIISRRALNSLLRLRENLRYMKAIYAIVGYPTTHIDTDIPLAVGERSTFSERFSTSLVAITSFTTFLRTLLLWIFVISFLFLILVIANALKVKFSGIDLLGQAAEAGSGWTFLVVLMSVFFAITCLNLYIMSIYLSNIYQEIKQRPLYIVESIKRF